MAFKLKNLYFASIISTVLYGEISIANIQNEAVEARFNNADGVVNQLLDLRAGLINHYNDKSSWPTQLSSLVHGNDRYYSGSFLTAFGSSIVGSISGSNKFYILRVDVGRNHIAEYISKRINGTSIGSSVVFEITKPSEAAIVEGVLLRKPDPDDPTNSKQTMYTDLIMNNHSIRDIDEAHAKSINAGDVVITKSLIVKGNSIFKNIDSDNIETSTLNTTDLKVNNNATFAGSTEFKNVVKFKSNIEVSGNAKFKKLKSDSLEITTLKSNGNADFLGNISVSNNINSKSINAETQTISNNQIVKKQEILENQTINGDQIVKGNQTINGNALIQGSATIDNLTVNNLSTLTGISNLGKINVSDDAIFMDNIWINESKTSGIGKGNNNALRVNVSSSYIDIGTLEHGWIDINSNVTGISFSDEIKAPKISIVGKNAEFVIRSPLNGQPAIKFSNDELIDDVTLRLTGNDELVLSGGLLKIEDGLYVSGESNFTKDVKYKGTELDKRFYNTGETVHNTKKLDGISIAQIARTDVDETFVENVFFNDRVYARNGINIQRGWLEIAEHYGIYFNEYGGGIHMKNSNWIEVYGGKGILTSGVIRADGGFEVDGKTVVSANGGNLFEDGQILSSRYYRKGTKVSDSDKLDGINSNQFARTDVDEIFINKVSFNGEVRLNGTAYYKGKELDSRFYNTGEKVGNANKIDGIDSSQLARTDTDEVFTENVTFNDRAYAKNGVHIQGDWLRINNNSGVYWESFGGGWHMTDNTWLRVYGGKNIYTPSEIKGGVINAEKDLYVKGTNVKFKLDNHESRISSLERKPDKSAQQVLDEVCTHSNHILVQRHGTWRCEYFPGIPKVDLQTTTLHTGAFRHSITLSCPGGWRRLSCYILTGDDKNADRHSGTQPIGNNSCRFQNGWGGHVVSYGFMDCFKI